VSRIPLVVEPPRKSPPAPPTRRDLDIVASLLQALGYPNATPSLGGRVLSSLLIAGGSDGIVNIYTKLGIRNPAERERRTVEAQADRARTLDAGARVEAIKAARKAADPVATGSVAGPLSVANAVADHPLGRPHTLFGDTKASLTVPAQLTSPPRAPGALRQEPGAKAASFPASRRTSVGWGPLT
jgi:hypothetical protein